MGLRLVAIGALAAASAWVPTPAASPPPDPLRVRVAIGGVVQEVATAVPVGAGRALTVAHALRDGAHIAVAGRPARVIAADRRLDLALLSVPGLRGAPLRLADDGDEGELAVLREGGVRTVRARVSGRAVARVRRPGGVDRRPVLELAARIVPGDSGAALTDSYGRVLGIVFARSTTQRRVAWAVDASAVRAIVERAGR